MRFRSLAASRREAEEVVDTWVDRFGRSGASTPASGVLALLGKEASEGAFKRLAPGRRLLHLATHGFSLDPGCLGGKDVGPGAHESPPRDQAPAFLPGRGMISNPLLFSGLALAGANRRAGAAAGEEDGILTAQEIAALDLSGTQWAVLSACDSRGGEILRNEGVFGLQRAFRIAGARTVVASLWPVEDEAARSWMHVFYRAALEEGLDTAAAARAASLALLRERRAQGAATHAFYWGGFVASGDWR
jgi:hypothetical protein